MSVPVPGPPPSACWAYAIIQNLFQAEWRFENSINKKENGKGCKKCNEKRASEILADAASVGPKS